MEGHADRERQSNSFLPSLPCKPYQPLHWLSCSGPSEILNVRAGFVAVIGSNLSGIRAFRISVTVGKLNAALLMCSSGYVISSSVGSLREQQDGCNEVAMFGR